MTWPDWFPDLNVTEHVFLAIILKLHTETNVIKRRAELVNAACGIWRPLFIEYMLNLYASIPHKLHSLIAEKYFFMKYWIFQATWIRFCIEKVCFCCWLLSYVLYAAAIFMTHFWPPTVAEWIKTKLSNKNYTKTLNSFARSNRCHTFNSNSIREKQQT